MLKNCLFILSLLLLGINGFSQTQAIQKIADSLDANNDHASDTSFIVSYLSKKSLSTEDKLCLQAVLVHKYLELQAWDICLTYCYKNVEEAHKIADFYSEAFFTKSIGNVFYYLKKNDKALKYWQKALTISSVNNILIIEQSCLQNIAAIYMEENRNFDIAEKYLLRAIEIDKLLKKENTPTGRHHYRLLATLYNTINKLEKAAKIYEQLINEARIVKDTALLIQSLIFYATSLAHKQQNPKDALPLCKEALQLTEAHNRLDELITVLALYSSVLGSIGNYKDAYMMSRKIDSINKKRFETDLSKKISEAEIKFNNYEIRHEKEVELLNARKQKQFIILISIGVFFIVASVLFILFERKKLKNKLAFQIQLQQEQKTAEEKLFSEKENERLRISRDLHDNMGAYTSALLYNVQQLKNKNAEDEVVNKMQQNAEQILNSLRETIWVLNNHSITIANFSEGFKNFCFKVIRNFENISFNGEETIENNITFSASTASCLNKILQEAIQNIIKHAQCTQINFQCVSNSKIQFILTDNGVGFNVNNITKGNGLDNMQWRAKEAGFNLSINSQLKKGTTIILEKS